MWVLEQTFLWNHMKNVFHLPFYCTLVWSYISTDGKVYQSLMHRIIPLTIVKGKESRYLAQDFLKVKWDYLDQDRMAKWKHYSYGGANM